MDFKKDFTILAEKYNLNYQYQDFKIALEVIGGFIHIVYTMILVVLQFTFYHKEER